MQKGLSKLRSRPLFIGASTALAATIGITAVAAPATAATIPEKPTTSLSVSSNAEVESGNVAFAELANQFAAGSSAGLAELEKFTGGGGIDIMAEIEKFTGGAGIDIMAEIEKFTGGSSAGTDIVAEIERLMQTGDFSQLLNQLGGLDPTKIIANAPADALQDPNKFAAYVQETVGVDLNNLLDTVGNTSKVAANSQTAKDDLPDRNGTGLELLSKDDMGGRLHTLTFKSDELNIPDTKVNVLLPSNYDQSKDYPTIYMLHGGAGTYNEYMNQGVDGMIDDAIVVMPDGGIAGWYANPVEDTGNNWETYHIEQLIPWIDANYNTIASGEGRAIGGFSMGGLGALKYTAKHPELFSAVTAFSGPADLRDRLGVVGHWANLSGAVDNGSVSGIYGAPWDDEIVSADNPIENIEQYRGKRVSFYSGDSADITEASVRAGHVKFDKALSEAGIEHNFTPFNGPHFVPAKYLDAEMKGMRDHLGAPQPHKENPPVGPDNGSGPKEDIDKPTPAPEPGLEVEGPKDQDDDKVEGGNTSGPKDEDGKGDTKPSDDKEDDKPSDDSEAPVIDAETTAKWKTLFTDTILKSRTS